MPVSLPHLSTGQMTTAAHWNNVTDAVNSIQMSSDGTTWQGYIRTANVGPHAIGPSINAGFQFDLSGAFAPASAPSGYVTALRIGTTMSAIANLDVHGMVFQPAFTEAASGTHNYITSAVVLAPVVTPGAATTNEAVTLLVNGAPSVGVRNYALHVVGGQTKLDGLLTVDQGAGTGEAVSIKSLAVAHGMTGVTETDTYGAISMYVSTDGGAVFNGYSEGTLGVAMFGSVTTGTTTKSTAAAAAAVIHGFKKSGAGVGSLGANSNILAVGDNNVVRFILDADGDSHQDVGTAWTNFDAHEDVELLHALSVGVSRQDDPLRQAFGAFLETHRSTLERERIVTFNDDGHHFINWSRTGMLLIGAIRQAGQKIAALESQVHDLSRRLEA